MLNPFLIGRQRDGEDQLTYALACTLQEIGGAGLKSLLATLGLDLKLPNAHVVAEVQTAAISTRPDARIEVPGHVVVLVESKVVLDSLRREQVVGHLDLFGAVQPSVRRVVLALCPDREPPSWWADAVTEFGTFAWVHGSWQAVYEWARAGAGDDEQFGEAGRLLLRGLADLIRNIGLGQEVERALDPDRVRRIERGAAAWTRDLIQQHEAQEALLHDLGVAFVKAAVTTNRLVPTAPAYSVGSRWRDPNCWSPVSSFLEIAWTGCPLPEWPVQKLWAEVFLHQKREPHRLGLRVGVLVEGKVPVQLWYGLLREAGASAFGDRYEEWRWRGTYGEVWAYRDFDSADPDGMVAGVVEDLGKWVVEVLPALMSSGPHT